MDARRHPPEAVPSGSASPALCGWRRWLVGLVVLAALAALALGDPYGASWPLRCPLHRLTGWLCPFCGTQRALHAALHGHLTEAFCLNPVLWLMAPWFVLLLAASLSERVAAWRVAQWARRRGVACAALGLLVLWGVVRNLM